MTTLIKKYLFLSFFGSNFDYPCFDLRHRKAGSSRQMDSGL